MCSAKGRENSEGLAHALLRSFCVQGGDLQIEQDLAYQKRAWFVQRIGWAVMMVVVVATAAGLFGDGVLSNASVGNDEFRIEYKRFPHYLSAAPLTIRAQNNSNDDLQIRISSAFLEAMKLDSVVPQPESVQAGPGWLNYTFKTAAPGQILVRFNITPEQTGWVTGTVTCENRQSLSFWQFVYP
jgi:hypothetical protein